jgi:hypothetical protein
VKEFTKRFRGNVEYAAGAYLAHLVLRQVDWSLRFHPGTAAMRRHLRLARLVIADIGS